MNSVVEVKTLSGRLMSLKLESEAMFPYHPARIPSPKTVCSQTTKRKTENQQKQKKFKDFQDILAEG